MSRSIAVFGAGSGLGQAVARRYARDGYSVTLVARRREPLEVVAEELAGAGATAHVVAADLARTEEVPPLAEQIRSGAGAPDVIYYGPTPDDAFVPAVDLTPKAAQDFMPLTFYTLVALVQEFLPHMLERGGAVLTAQGASSLQGLPHMSGAGPAQAAQRNYLQSLEAELADKNVTVGRLYIGAAIENSDFHVEMERAKEAGEPVWEMPVVDPGHLVDLLRSMQDSTETSEITYP